LEISLINASVFELPVSRRAGAIVYDGTSDLGTWRPPGPDRELLFAYGDTLGDVLAKERAQLEGGGLSPDQALRLHPGKLRCDYLIWVGSRGSHGETAAAAAPDLATVERLAAAALELASRHDTVRVAFGAMGDGPGAEPVAERLAAVVRGADAFRRARLQQGRASSVEEVLVCAPSAAEVAKAKRLVARMAKQVVPAAEKPGTAGATRRRTATRSAGTRKPRASAKPKLDPAEVSAARARADAYAISHSYAEGDWLLHPKFGVGRVMSVVAGERMIYVLFDDGEQRRLVHER
jgi:O-acetyl-ADP-ribose deacetylase (regulator of RNase III)